jgi:hypothetical protein
VSIPATIRLAQLALPASGHYQWVLHLVAAARREGEVLGDSSRSGTNSWPSFVGTAAFDARRTSDPETLTSSGNAPSPRPRIRSTRRPLVPSLIVAPWPTECPCAHAWEPLPLDNELPAPSRPRPSWSALQGPCAQREPSPHLQRQARRRGRTWREASCSPRCTRLIVRLSASLGSGGVPSDTVSRRRCAATPPVDRWSTAGPRARALLEPVRS